MVFQSAAKGSVPEDLHLLERRLARQRVLHIALNPVERGILHLCCRLNLQVRSRILTSALASIFVKASLWLSPSFLTRALSMGRPLAAANVRAALAMGNFSASAWTEDGDYLLLLGVPGFLVTLGGPVAGGFVLESFGRTKEVAVGTTLITVILLVVGTVIMATSLILKFMKAQVSR